MQTSLIPILSRSRLRSPERYVSVQVRTAKYKYRCLLTEPRSRSEENITRLDLKHNKQRAGRFFSEVHPKSFSFLSNFWGALHFRGDLYLTAQARITESSQGGGKTARVPAGLKSILWVSSPLLDSDCPYRARITENFRSRLSSLRSSG